ncbi:UMP kinase [Nanoarchaeota archaeon]
MKKETIIMSLGGSLIFPEEIDVKFLDKFRKLILKHIKKGKKFILITGGGKICRKYQGAAKKIVNLSKEDLDWMGIKVTHMNAYFVKTLFRDFAYKDIIIDPNVKIKTNKKIIVGGGWRPGCSTDFDAVLIAKNFKAKEMINLTNMDYVYTKDPKKYKSAKIVKEMSWAQMRKIVGNKWEPGANLPFDPIASKMAHDIGLKVIITNGKDLKNLDKIFSGKKFKGSVIE